MTLADEDTNSILTDNDNRAIQDDGAMQVTQPGWNFVTIACGVETETFSKTDPERVRASTSNPRLTCDYPTKD